jgi:hypothetical protein
MASVWLGPPHTATFPCSFHPYRALPPLALTHRNRDPRRFSSPSITRRFTRPSVDPDRDDLSPRHARLGDLDEMGGKLGNQMDSPPRYRLTGRLPTQSGLSDIPVTHTPPLLRPSPLIFPRTAVRHPISYIFIKAGATRRGGYGYMGCKWSWVQRRRTLSGFLISRRRCRCHLGAQSKEIGMSGPPNGQ